MPANTKINPEALAEFEERKKDGGEAIRIANTISKTANRNFMLTASGFALAAASIMVVNSPLLFLTVPAGIMVATTALSRVGKNQLRSEFNRMAGEVGPGARMMLRPIDSAIPRHSALGIDDIHPQQHPVRIWGGALIGFFVSLPLALMWVSGLMLAQETKSVGDLKNKAKDVEAQYRLQGYKPPQP